MKSVNSQKSLQAKKVHYFINYLIDAIDSITEQIIKKVPSIPLPIRMFSKAIYDTILKGNKSESTRIEAFRLISSFIFE